MYKYFLCLLLLLLPAGAFAGSRVVVENVATLQAMTASPGNLITITCYYASTDNSICTGGGDFNRGTCGTDTDNGATVLQDNVSPDKNCYYRKNFGLNGIVDARQCGVVGDGLTANDVNALITCMNLAAANGIYRTFTGGGIILDDHTYGNITPPQGMELTCAINPTGEVEGNKFLIGHGLSNALVLDLRDTLALSQDSASLANCNVVAGDTGGGPDGDQPNPYSPAYWYPDCDYMSTTCNDTGHTAKLRSAILEYSAFNPNPTAAYPEVDDCGPPPAASGCGPASNSVGVTITGNKNALRNVTFMGFGKCYSSVNGGKGMIIEHITGDCDGGVSIDSSHEATQIDGVQIKPFLTSGNGTASLITLKVDALQKDMSSGKYAATVEFPSDLDFAFKQYDTVWIATSPYNSGSMVGGAESAAGRWTVDNDPGDPAFCSGTSGPKCQTLVLAGSMGEPASRYSDSGSPLTIGATGGVTLNSTVGGVPPNAITGISTDPTTADQKTLQLIAVGQTVTDGGVCIPGGATPTTVTNVWPAKGIVYLSAPVLSTCPANTSEAVNFYDAAFRPQSGDCSTNSGQGCAFVSADERFGDGIVISESGGVTVFNCGVLEHLVAFHWSTNTNSSRFSNCATGENIALPDQDIVGLKIDGKHSTDSKDADACGNMFVNGILGQHRTVGIVVQSNCSTPNHLTNVRFSGNSGGRRNAVSAEVDAGTLVITNGDDTGNGNLFKADGDKFGGDTLYPAQLSIGNNQLPEISLIMANAAAAATTGPSATTGCGNTFIVLTPYLCTPAPANLLPGGRLALPAGTHGNCTSAKPPPVMRADAVGAQCVFYLPYRGQQVPIYDPGAAGFGLADIGAGLMLPLDPSSSNKQAAQTAYDIFVETVHTGSPELCVGPAWMTGSTARSSDIQQVQGIWVNAATLLKCQYDSGPSKNFICPALQCTYLGSMYMTADGQTTQQFGPNSKNHGNGNCLCLYNAYNRVPVVSMSLDHSGAYGDNGATWHPMNPSAGAMPGALVDNTITMLDGLGESAVDALLSDSANAVLGPPTNYPSIGLLLNATSGTPAYFAQNQAASFLPMSTPLRNPPQMGLWFVQAMAVVSVNTSSPVFGGPGQQQLSLNVQD